ncbi:MAG: succinylglutamate desuccinylase/aspartoacylase family protein [Gammaproteobacteria bacterium]|nr:succinylglutamate desuccinylase/aspartoacylase family protein [Gammaproteobacteria bacterium]
MAKHAPRKPLKIGGVTVEPGERATIDFPIPRLYTHSELDMPVHVIHARHDGPRLFVTAALHGDELNGVEIIRRLLRSPVLRKLRGTLIAIPIVNVHGCIQRSRYLPDGRDLNRAFPGSHTGSLAARLAYLLMSQILVGCDFGVDLHTGSRHRANLPQIRACMDDARTLQLARIFGVPVIIDANLRDGSLRQAVWEQGTPVLIYEAGEALRFDELAVRGGLNGVTAVMAEIGMLPPTSKKKRPVVEPMLARSTSWLRAPASGILRAIAALGAKVKKGETLGFVGDPFGENEAAVIAPADGVIIGRTNLPLVYEGEALFHQARFAKDAPVEEAVEAFQAELDPELVDKSEPSIT